MDDDCGFSGHGVAQGTLIDSEAGDWYATVSYTHLIQAGWFGKVLKDKFNIQLNIIAPQVSGDANSLYQTRSASASALSA